MKKSKQELEFEKVVESYEEKFGDLVFPITFISSFEKDTARLERCIKENKPFKYYFSMDEDVIY
jgi:Leucine-rich repeat (LRR) protein